MSESQLCNFLKKIIFEQPKTLSLLVSCGSDNIISQLMKYSFLFLFLILVSSCKKQESNTTEDISKLSWNQIEKNASGKSVTMMMWMGDAKINKYIKDYIIPKVKKENNIDLSVVDGQGTQIVQLLMAETQANKATSDIDLIWINGETFYQLKQINALYGPWANTIPNAKYIDFDNPFIGTDFQQKTDGYELPWGNVQMALIYNAGKVKNPPQTRAELLHFVKKNPGVFTFDNQFTGLTFLKALLVDISGSKTELSGKFDEAKYQKYSAQLWDYINQLKPYMWRKGAVFPAGVPQMHQLFANGELWFTMSNNDAEVDSKIAEGLFPPTTKSYVPQFGTIQNSHYLGITKKSNNKAAAMVVANTMVSVAAQLEKMDPKVWGDGTVLSMDKISAAEKEKFNSIPSRKNSPNRADIKNRAIQELAPEYMIRLAEDFRKQIILK